DDPAAVRAERQPQNGEAPRRLAVALSPCPEIPDGQTRPMAGGELAAVGAEGHATDSTCQPAAREDLVTGRQVAHHQISGPTRNERARAGYDSTAVRAERHGVDHRSGLAESHEI